MTSKKTKRLLTIATFLLAALLIFSCSQMDLEEDPMELVAGSTECVNSTNGKVKVIILSGQSNAAGVSPVRDISPQKKSSTAQDFTMFSYAPTETQHIPMFLSLLHPLWDT